MGVWDDTFLAKLSKGHDHGSAAYSADLAEKRVSENSSIDKFIGDLTVEQRENLRQRLAGHNADVEEFTHMGLKFSTYQDQKKD